MSKIVDLYKQYGFIGFISRLLKSILRKTGINFEQYYYLVNDIDREKQLEIWNRNPLRVKHLVYEDFLLGDKSVFTEKKLSLIRERLNNGYYAYGIIENGKLIYSCMLSTRELQVHAGDVLLPLAENECLMVAAYCAPEARGRGIHSQMNAYRLLQTLELGREKCVAIVLKENVPAFKSQIKVGYKVEFIFYVCKVGNKVFTNFYKKKNKC